MDPNMQSEELKSLKQTETVRKNVGTGTWKAHHGRPICAVHHRHLFKAMQKTMYPDCKEITFFVHPCCMECVSRKYASEKKFPKYDDSTFATFEDVAVPCIGCCCDTKHAAYKETRDLVEVTIHLDSSIYHELYSQCSQQGRDTSNAMQKPNAGAFLSDANFNVIRLAIKHSDLRHEYAWTEAVYTLLPVAFNQIFAHEDNTFMLVRENDATGVLGVYGSTPSQIYHAPCGSLVKYWCGNEPEVWRAARALDHENNNLFKSSPAKAIPEEVYPEDPVQIVRPTGGMPTSNGLNPTSQDRHGYERFSKTDGPTLYPYALGSSAVTVVQGDDPIDDDATHEDPHPDIAWLHRDLSPALTELVTHNAALAVPSDTSSDDSMPPLVRDEEVLQPPPGLENFAPEKFDMRRFEHAITVLSNHNEEFFNPDDTSDMLHDPLECCDGFNALAAATKSLIKEEEVSFTKPEEEAQVTLDNNGEVPCVATTETQDDSAYPEPTTEPEAAGTYVHPPTPEVPFPFVPQKEMFADKEERICGLKFMEMRMTSKAHAHQLAREEGKPVRTTDGDVVLPPGAFMSKGIKQAKTLAFATRVIANDFSTLEEDSKLMQGKKVPLAEFMHHVAHFDKTPEFAGMKGETIPNPLKSLKAFMRAYRRQEEDYGPEVGVSVVWDANGITIPANRKMDLDEDITYMYGHKWTNDDIKGPNVMTRGMSGQSQCASHPQAVQVGYEFTPLMHHQSVDGAVLQGLMTRLVTKVVLPKTTEKIVNKNKKRTHVPTKWVNKVDRVMKVFDKKIVSREEVEELMKKYPDMILLKSPTMSYERYRKGIEKILRENGELGAVSAMTKIETSASKSKEGIAHNVDYSELHECAEVTEDQPTPEDDKPRIIINDGDLYQLAILYSAKIFAKLFFHPKYRFHIKGCSKHDAMRETAALFAEGFWHMSIIESDGKAWDSCCGPEVRGLIENKVLKKISDILYSDGCDSTLPLQARVNEHKHRCADTVRVESDTIDAKAKKGSREPKGCIDMRAVRRSGDGMTSAGNGLINLILWAVCVLDRPDIFFSDLADGSWHPKKLYRYSEDIMGVYPPGDKRAGQKISNYWGVFVPKVEGDDGVVGLTLPIASTPQQFILREDHDGNVHIQDGDHRPTQDEYYDHLQKTADKITEILDNICKQWTDFGFNMSLKPLLRGSCPAASGTYLRIEDFDKKLRCVVANKEIFNAETVTSWQLLNFYEFFTFTGFDFLVCMVDEFDLHTTQYHLPSLLRTLHGSAWSTSKLVCQPGPHRFANVHRVGYLKMMSYAINCVNHEHYSMYFEKSAQYHLECLKERKIITDINQVDHITCDEETSRKIGAPVRDLISLRDELAYRKSQRSLNAHMYDLLATVSTGAKLKIEHRISLNNCGVIHPTQTKVEMFFPPTFFRHMTYKELHSNSCFHTKFMVGRMNTYGSEGPGASADTHACEVCLRDLNETAFPAVVNSSFKYHSSHEGVTRRTIWSCKECRAQQHQDKETIDAFPGIRDPEFLGRLNPYGKEGPVTVYCEVCHMYLNGSMQAVDHYNGKKHLKRLRNFGDGSSWDTICVYDPVSSSVKLSWIVYIISQGFLTMSDLDSVVQPYHLRLPYMYGNSLLFFADRYGGDALQEIQYRHNTHGTNMRIHPSGPHLDADKIEASDKFLKDYLRKIYNKLLEKHRAFDTSLLKACVLDILLKIKKIESGADDHAREVPDTFSVFGDTLSEFLRKFSLLRKYVVSSVAMRYLLKVVELDENVQDKLMSILFNGNNGEFRVSQFHLFSTHFQGVLREQFAPRIRHIDPSRIFVLTHHQSQTTEQLLRCLDFESLNELNWWFLPLCLDYFGVQEEVRALGLWIDHFDYNNLDVRYAGSYAACLNEAHMFAFDDDITIRVVV